VHFKLLREHLLKALQMVMGAVERKQTMAILANVRLEARSHQLLLTTTDLEIELEARVVLSEPAQTGETTVSARKLLDIVRSLPVDSVVDFSFKEQKMLLRCGKSRFNLQTLSADDFPNIEDAPNTEEIAIQPTPLMNVIHAVQFSIAQDDVRPALNGMFLDFAMGKLIAVTTDGHRLAVCEYADATLELTKQIILPRKATQELMRLLADEKQPVTLSISANFIRVVAQYFTFTAKLIEGRFPDYNRVLPRDCQNEVVIERDQLKSVLSRVAVLLSDKYRGVRLKFRPHLLTVMASNPEHEMAEEEVELNYQGDDVDIGFNANYILDVLAVIPAGEVCLSFNDANSSLLITSCVDDTCRYVIMPMRL
jgi:DNA polymerase III subunit beta